jgi:hypothetical protein
VMNSGVIYIESYSSLTQKWLTKISIISQFLSAILEQNILTI